MSEYEHPDYEPGVTQSSPQIRPWVVVATMTPWEEVPRIRHQIARGLTRYYRVFYIEFPTRWRKKYPGRLTEPEAGISVWRPSNWLTLPGRCIAQYPGAGLFEARYLRQAVRRVLQRNGIEPEFVINFDHRNSWIQDPQLFRRTVYVCNDDHSLPFAGSKPQPRLADWTRRQMREAARRADVCLITSDHYARLLDVGQKARVFFPGHDLPTLQSAQVAAYQTNQQIRVGYMGYVSPRLNIDWIQRAAQQPDIRFHVIGPVTGPSLETRLAANNVVRHEPLTGPALLDWLLEMDVLAIPYRISREEALGLAAPNKIFAYLAAGKPVVVSELPSLREWCANTIYRATDRESFTELIRRARQEDSTAFAMQRLAIAREHTWSKQIDALRDLLELETEVSCGVTDGRSPVS